MEVKSVQTILEVLNMVVMEDKTEEDPTLEEETEKSLVTEQGKIHMVVAADGNAKLKDS